MRGTESQCSVSFAYRSNECSFFEPELLGNAQQGKLKFSDDGSNNAYASPTASFLSKDDKSAAKEISELLTINFGGGMGSRDSEQSGIWQIASLDAGDLLPRSSQPRLQEEITRAKELAGALSLGLETLPNDRQGEKPEYKKVAATVALLPTLVEVGTVAVEAVGAFLVKFLGVAVATEVARKAIKRTNFEQSDTKINSDPRAESETGLKIKTDAGDNRYYEMVCVNIPPIRHFDTISTRLLFGKQWSRRRCLRSDRRQDMTNFIESR